MDIITLISNPEFKTNRYDERGLGIYMYRGNAAAFVLRTYYPEL